LRATGPAVAAERGGEADGGHSGQIRGEELWVTTAGFDSCIEGSNICATALNNEIATVISADLLA
jgi:hypothetical protein